jgi:hypothetical protein
MREKCTGRASFDAKNLRTDTNKRLTFAYRRTNATKKPAQGGLRREGAGRAFRVCAIFDLVVMWSGPAALLSC